MKRYSGLLAVIAVAGLCVWGFVDSLPTAEARIGDTIVHKIITPPEGYSTVVCSFWVNNGNLLSKEYFFVDPPTGYHIERTQVYAMNCSEAQVCSVSIFTTTAKTDSSVIMGATTDGTAKRYALDFNTGDYGLRADWPIRCTRVAFDKVASTDDIMVLVYCRNY